MILADKIIRLRKKNGWSQEEFAQKMQVSRQAVSKWEGAQSIPDLEKIIVMSQLFEVTTDYLLKDEIEVEEFLDDDASIGEYHVTIEQANQYLQWRKKASNWIAIGTFLCIIAVIPLLLLGAGAESKVFPISENFAGGLGLIILFILVAIAVSLFIYTGFKNEPYDFLDKKEFTVMYGVAGLVKEKKNEYRPRYLKGNIIGILLCVLSPISLFGAIFKENDFLTVLLLCITIGMVAIGAFFLIVCNVQWSSFQRLLQEGEFSTKEKQKNKVKGVVSSIYWIITTALYLAWSLTTKDWQMTWIVWPIAAVLYAAISSIIDFLWIKEKN